MRRILNTNRGNRQRGVTMLGLMALAALLAVCCATILDRSTDAYRASAMLEWRLQARAAAEGVAVIIRDNPTRKIESQTLGSATVTCAPATPGSNRESLVSMEVAIKPRPNTKARYTSHYKARFVHDAAGTRLLRLEE